MLTLRLGLSHGLPRSGQVDRARITVVLAGLAGLLLGIIAPAVLRAGQAAGCLSSTRNRLSCG